MTKKEPSSRVILEVERAISDLRRGEPVLLTGLEGGPLRIMSAEYFPDKKAVDDANHPAVKLMKWAGLLPGAVVEEMKATSDMQDMLSVSVEAIGQYSFERATALEQISDASVPLLQAENARIIAFRPRFGHEEHLAVVIGDITKSASPYVRVHSSCVTGDVFSSLRCDCGNQLHKAIDLMVQAGAGVVLYLSQEGRGIGIANKLRAYGLQDKGMDTVEANEALGFLADERDFRLATTMLKQLELTRITLITNNPEKVKALEMHGITVTKRVPLLTEINVHNERYLDTKTSKLGHQLHDS